MTITVPVAIPAPALDLPDPSDLATWGARMAEMHRWMREDASPGMSLLGTSAYDNALEALTAATNAAGSANFKGAWSALTGAAALPYSVWHSSRVWALLNPLADVTTSEPGVSADWVDVGGVKRSGDTMTGPLEVPAGATGSQVPRTSEVVSITGATGAAAMPSGTTGQRPGSLAGYTRFNSTLGCNETYNGSTWVQGAWQFATAAASGTSTDFSGIPAWVNEVVLSFEGVSTNGSSPLLVQLGDAGGLETSGYTGAHAAVLSTPVMGNLSGGFHLPGASATNVIHGSMVLKRLSGNLWSGCAVLGRSSVAVLDLCSGTKTLSDVLTTVRVRTTNGTDTFDAGTLYLAWRA